MTEALITTGMIAVFALLAFITDKLEKRGKCSKCLRVQQTKCVLCGDPIIIGVCENCAPWAFYEDEHFKASDVHSFRKRLDSEIDTIIENEGNGHA